MDHLAVVRVRGIVGVSPKVKDTLLKLRLHHKNSCVVVPSIPDRVSMVKRAKDFVTFGEIDEETFSELLIKRGKLASNKPLTDSYLKSKGGASFVKDFIAGKKTLKDMPGVKPWFRLSPPRKGFERGGIKKPFSIGGALGYRGKKINDLLRRMI